MKTFLHILSILLLTAFFFPTAAAEESPKPIKILYIAGAGSHEYGGHEHNAGAIFLADYLRRYVSGQPIYPDGKTAPKLEITICHDARPGDTFPWEDADVVVIHSDGDGAYPLAGHEESLIRLREKGVGFVFLHYSLCGTLRFPAADTDFIRDTLGGVYETHHSVNPFYTAEFPAIPDHPITRGVRPFTLYDEWYFHMRFADGLTTEDILAETSDEIRAILVTIPPDAEKLGPDGAHSGNPAVRARLGLPEIVAWAAEREDGGRGFGFTGLDVHWNFAHPDFRKILLQAILWSARVDIPPRGIDTPSPTFETLQENLDEENPLTPEQEAEIRARIEAWNL